MSKEKRVSGHCLDLPLSARDAKLYEEMPDKDRKLLMRKLRETLKDSFAAIREYRDFVES